jgi:hypothetical protein
MNIKTKDVLAILIVILTMTSLTLWSSIPIGSTITDWVLFGFIIFIFLFKKNEYYNPSNDSHLWFVKKFVLWVLICFVRGLFVAEYYWDFKNLINASCALFLSLSIYIFTNPNVLKRVLNTWLHYAFPLFIFFIPILHPLSFGYYLFPISFLALFIPALTFKWRFIILGVSLFVILSSLDARSNVIKFLVPMLFSMLFYIKFFLRSKFFILINIIIFFVPIFLFILAVNGTFNIFNLEENVSGNYTSEKIKDGEKIEENLMVDTRTFLYEEVIFSALKNDYVLFGRTPARGNDSFYFGNFTAEELGTKRYERYSNEVSILNIFTWTGLVGVVLYFFIFFKATYLAIVKSKSSFLKILGLYVSFRWATAWVEDFNRFDIMNLMLWMVIAMCYSKKFRKMTDFEFKIWINKIFKNKYTFFYN